jgi:hypothetical protein
VRTRFGEGRRTERPGDLVVVAALHFAAFLQASFPAHLSPASFLSSSTTNIASLTSRVCCRQARVFTQLLPCYRVRSFASARFTAESAPDNAERNRRSVFHHLRPQRAPIASIMSSSDDDTPLVRGKPEGECTARIAHVQARHGYLPLARRLPLSSSTRLTLQLSACPQSHYLTSVGVNSTAQHG